MIPNSELILNPDGSIYHLGILPSQVPKDIITVGDPDRVDAVTKHFDKIHFSKQIREFKSTLGSMGGKEILVISTGIGTDNIDIVFTELDACVNINFKSRTLKDNHTSLNFHRIGTSGTLRNDIAVGSLLISKYAIGLGGLMNFYNYQKSPDVLVLENQFKKAAKQNLSYISSYVGSVGDSLYDKFKTKDMLSGVTLTAPGFYGPQGRSLRLGLAHEDYLGEILSYDLGENKVTNLEMETAGIYAMSNALGHNAISLNALLANRITGEFAENPRRMVEGLIELVLEKV
jgi:uridine phosphorylase